MFRGNSITEAARLLFLLAVLMSFGPASSIPVGLLTAGVLGKFGTSEGTTVVMSDAGLLPAEEAEAPSVINGKRQESVTELREDLTAQNRRVVVLEEKLDQVLAVMNSKAFHSSPLTCRVRGRDPAALSQGVLDGYEVQLYECVHIARRPPASESPSLSRAVLRLVLDHAWKHLVWSWLAKSNHVLIRWGLRIEVFSQPCE